MEALEHHSLNEQRALRQQLLSIVGQLSNTSVQEVIQFADYLVYRDNHAAQPSAESIEHNKDALPKGKSIGYQKLKESGLIGFGEAEADLSETYKARYAQEITQKYDHC